MQVITYISALGICVITLDALFDFLPGYVTHHTAWQYYIIFGTSYSVTAATSLLATLMIAYRIYSFTSRSIKRSRKYRYINEIMVQSVSVYTALMIGQALSVFLTPSTSSINPTAYIANCYLTALGTLASVSR